MIRTSLTAKVLIAIAVTLTVCFACLGILSLYLSYNSMLDLQRTSARQSAASVIQELTELKMRGDFDVFNKYVEDVIKRGGALKIQLFKYDGKEYGGQDSSELIRKAVATGAQQEENVTIDGKSALRLAVPLVNEARCNACHAPGPKYLGGLQLAASLEEGVVKAKKLALVLTCVGALFFFLIIGLLYMLISMLVVRPIKVLSAQVEDIARGEGI